MIAPARGQSVKPGTFGGTEKLDGWNDRIFHFGGDIHPIGEKQPNDFGLHDMDGNVREWCKDQL